MMSYLCLELHSFFFFWRSELIFSEFIGGMGPVQNPRLIIYSDFIFFPSAVWCVLCCGLGIGLHLIDSFYFILVHLDFLSVIFCVKSNPTFF